MKINKQEIARCQRCGTMQAVRDENAIMEMDSYTLCCEQPEYFIKDSLWDEYGVTKLLHDSVIVSIIEGDISIKLSQEAWENVILSIEIGVGEMGYEEEMMWDIIEEIKKQSGCQKKDD